MTVHTGETPLTGPKGVIAALERWQPARIGHGIAAAQSEEALRKLAERAPCSRSALARTCARARQRPGRLGRVLRTFDEHGVAFTINTDGPYLLNTHLRQEFDLLLEAGALTPARALRCVEAARAATFLG